jgi:hypothetical protein
MNFNEQQPNPNTPGGTSRGVPPVPNRFVNTLMPAVNDDGDMFFIEFDDMGVPLGEWKWKSDDDDDDEGEWFFEFYDEDVPLGEFIMPVTGEARYWLYATFTLGIGLILTGAALRFQKKRNRSITQE